MFLLIAVIVFSSLSVTVLFNLEEIVVEGDSIYTFDELVDGAGIVTGVNLLRLDTESYRQQLIDNFVYIDSVRIRKKFPSKLTVYVDGAVEMANIEHEGVYYIVSKNGRILREAEIITSNTIVYGFEAVEPEVGGYIKSEDDRKNAMVYDIINTKTEAGLTGIISIDISDRMDIRMNYMNRVELLIGTEDELEIKLKGAAEMVENNIDINESGTLRLMETPMLVFRRDLPESALILPDELIAESDDDDEAVGESI